jgi:predicted enzyme related to lactoylglutathione lyase
MITDIGIVSVPVSNQDRAKQFYVDLLGLECTIDAPFGPGRRWIQVAPKGSKTSLALVTWFENMTPGGISGLVLVVDDLDTTYAELVARGVVFEKPPYTEPFGKFALLNDPDGNRFVLSQQEPIDPPR